MSVLIDGTGVGIGVFIAIGLRIPSLVSRGGYITGALGNGSSIIIGNGSTISSVISGSEGRGEGLGVS